MKTFYMTLEENQSKDRIFCEVEAMEFPTAASKAYLQRHHLSQKTGNDWRILSLSERGWRVVDVSAP